MVETVPTVAVRADVALQPRVSLDIATIAEYAAAMRDGAAFPPVVVFHDGAAYWLADGFHRVAAARQAEAETIAADVRQGTRRDALLFAVGANADHGLRRTNADKRRAVEILLGDDEWVGWSDREIARQCRVSHEFVRRLRPAVTVNVDSERTYTTRHGTVATMQTAAIGRLSEPEPTKPSPRPEPPALLPTLTVRPEPEPEPDADPPFVDAFEAVPAVVPDDPAAIEALRRSLRPVAEQLVSNVDRARLEVEAVDAIYLPWWDVDEPEAMFEACRAAGATVHAARQAAEVTTRAPDLAAAVHAGSMTLATGARLVVERERRDAPEVADLRDRAMAAWRSLVSTPWLTEDQRAARGADLRALDDALSVGAPPRYTVVPVAVVDSHEYPSPPRGPVDPEHVARLVDSIGRVGLRHPIVVMARGGRHQLVAGRHRLAAVRELGWRTLPVTVVSADVADLARIDDQLAVAPLDALTRAEIEVERESLVQAQDGGI